MLTRLMVLYMLCIAVTNKVGQGLTASPDPLP